VAEPVVWPTDALSVWREPGHQGRPGQAERDPDTPPMMADGDRLPMTWPTIRRLRQPSA